jgi:RimJ/RimL family protein N-acetyltransferase
VYEKLGFVREGRLRQDHYREGRYVDVLVMGLLREEWRPDDA